MFFITKETNVSEVWLENICQVWIHFTKKVIDVTLLHNGGFEIKKPNSLTQTYDAQKLTAIYVHGLFVISHHMYLNINQINYWIKRY